LPSHRRPKFVTLLSLGVLTFGVVNLIGLAAWFKLPELPLALPSWYLPFRNAIWASAAIIASMGLFFGKWWSPRFARWACVIIFIWSVLDHLFLKRSAYASRSFMAHAILAIIALSLLFWILRQPSSKVFYGENPHE